MKIEDELKMMSDDARADVLKTYITEVEKTRRANDVEKSARVTRVLAGDGIWVTIVLVVFIVCCVLGGVTCAWHDVKTDGRYHGVSTAAPLVPTGK